MAPTAAEPQGIQFPLDAKGRRRSAEVGRGIVAAALQALDPAAAEACRSERNWRHAYPAHIRRLVELQATQPQAVVASCRAGLEAAWAALPFLRDGQSRPLREAMASPTQPALRTLRVAGQGDAAPRRCEVPYQGRRLQGDSLARRIDVWCAAGIIEESHAQALHLARTHPDWFDLSDRHMVLLGAGSEAGPLGWLAGWRANIVAVDLPRPAVWKKIAQRVREGNARLIAPLAADAGDEDPARAGADLLTQTPEIAAWLRQLDQPLDIFAIAYLDGERHVRVSLAMDAIGQAMAPFFGKN